MTWVFDHSPYTLGTRLLHLAIADIVNEDNDWLLWASQPKLAAKAKVSIPTVGSGLKRMCADGYLELVEKNVGRPSVYRFLRPTPKESEGSSSSDPESSPGATPKDDTVNPPSSTDLVLLPTQGNGIETTQPRARSFEEEFEIIWARYPKKEDRKPAFNAFVARRRAGVEPVDLWHATCNYHDTCFHNGTERQFIMSGATFFGPNDRYLKYVERPLIDEPTTTRRRAKPGGDSDPTPLGDLLEQGRLIKEREDTQP